MSYHELTRYQKLKFCKDLKILQNDLNRWGFEILDLKILFVRTENSLSTHNESVNVRADKTTENETPPKKAD